MILLNALHLAVSSDHFNTMANLIFVAVDMNIYEVTNILVFFLRFKILNVLIIGEFHGKFQVFTYNPFFLRYPYSLDVNSRAVNNLFPDKLINLNHNPLNALAYMNFPRVMYIIKTGWFGGPEVFFSLNMLLNITRSTKFRESMDTIEN